jgi:hypothetical protein
MDCGLPAFVDDVPEYEIRDGRMYICMRGMCLAMPVHVFTAGMARANRELDAWFEQQRGTVVPIKASRA